MVHPALTPREQEVVALLRGDPTMTPGEIARRLGTSRDAINVHLSNLGKKGVVRGRGYLLDEEPAVVVVGGTNLDVKARSDEPLVAATSNPGSSVMTPGGVGRNIAENLARLGTRTFLVSVVGNDAAADTVLEPTATAGVRLDHVHRTEGATGSYVAVLGDDGELVAAVSDMTATAQLDPARLDRARDVITGAELVVLDGNLRLDTLAHAVELAHAAGVRTLVDPVSVPKARSLANRVRDDRPLFAITPNRDELAALAGLATDTDDHLLAAADRLHERGVQHAWVRLGPRGSLLSTAQSDPAWLPTLPTDVVEVTGAGDSMLAAFAHALLHGADAPTAARHGHAAAAATIASQHTVRPDLSTRLLDDLLDRAPNTTTTSREATT